MRYLYAGILLACAVIAIYYATRIFYNRNYKKVTYRFLTILSASSAVWSLGYGMMFLVNNMTYYSIFRAVGIVGIILYIISGQMIIGVLDRKLYMLSWIIIPELIIGILVLIMMVQPSSYRMIVTSNGIITEFASDTAAVLYTLYCVVIAITSAAITVRMARNKESKQNQAIGRSLLKLELLIAIGMVVDTLLPAMGTNLNIPASSMLQFMGLVIIYYALVKYNRNVVSIENMAGYIYQSLKLPVFVFDQNHKIILANENGRKIMGGVSEERLKEINVWNYLEQLPPENIDEAKSTINMDVVVVDRDLNLSLSIDPIFNDYHDYLGYIVVASDITEHLRNIRLQESTEMKTQFLANMSHEIRTPLNAILGFNDAILQNSSNQQKVNNYALSIHEAGENLKGIINSILDISKIEMGQLEIDSNEYSTVQLLDNITSMFEMLAQKKGLTFETDIDPNLPEVLIGDEQHLRQVLINILNNAIKYTDQGSVKLTVKMMDQQDDALARSIFFSVKDTGRGIKISDREKLFEKYSRLDTQHFKHTEGTGLGMSIVLYTLKAMGSEIKFDSVYGEGSDFYFVLKQIALGQESIGDFLTRRKEIEIKTIKNTDFRAPRAKILIVDDVEMNIEAASALMEFTQIQIDKALSGKEAIELARSKDYHIIFMDHMMPEMDGLEATEAIRNLSLETGDAYFASVPIVALTANVMVGMREIYQHVGMQDYISKPIEIDAMISVLKKWLPGDVIERATNIEPVTVISKEEEAPAEVNEWNVEIEGIDLIEAQKYNANFEGFEKNMHAFERAYENNRNEIEAFYEAKDCDNYVIKVHGLKSTSKLIGSMTLSEMARQIEEKGRNGQMEETEYLSLMDLYGTCIERIRDYFADGETEEPGEKEILSEEECRVFLKRIQEAADSFDMDEFTVLEEELPTITVPEEYAEIFQELENLIATLSFSQISELIQEKGF